MRWWEEDPWKWDEPKENMTSELYKALKDHEFAIKHIHCDPKHKVTVVVFMDDSKEICRCAKSDEYNEYAGICICIAKHLYGKSKLERFINTKKKVIYNNNNQKGAK